MMKTVILFFSLLIFSALAAQKDSVNINYMRSSLATFFVDNGKQEQDQIVKTAFLSKFAPDKYNNHELNERIIPNPLSKRNDELVSYLDSYFQENKTAKSLIAKWFNRSKKGGFDINLLMKRGLYDAKELDKQIAKNTVGGNSKIIDKGENLIDNTFVVVMVSNYTNKENVASGLKSGLNFLQNVGLVNTSVTSELAKTAVTTLGKGYWVKTHSYLFKLVWDDETRHRFYNELWTSDDNLDLSKVSSWDNSDIFKLEYVGETGTGADVQSSTLSSKSDAQIIERATIKSFDKAITNLQQEYDVFALKLPIYTVDPIITIKAGKKEGITPKSKFAVFELQQDESGVTELVQVGKLKVDKDYPIWDNQFGADDDNKQQDVDCTVLKAVSMKGEIVPGMLVIQTK